MKKYLLILFSLLSLVGYSQTYPINEPFNTLGGWTVTNGAGLQTYGAGLNYLTTNIGNTPYPNSSTITMTSPVYSFTNCVGVLSLSFPIDGRIENGNDIMIFQVFNGAWNTLGTYTGNQNNIFNFVISNNVTRFRFRLVTNGSVNSYGPWWNTSVYYYDIDYFNITCTNALPIELISFDGANDNNQNILFWKTATESNNKGFNLQRSENGYDWTTISFIEGHGNSLELNQYTFIDRTYKFGLNYYRLEQIDFDGSIFISNIVDIDNSKEINSKVIKKTNLMGQEVSDTYTGTVILYNSDGSTKIILQNNQ